MAKARKQTQESTEFESGYALTPEARENQLIALATNLAEKQMREGTASSQVITHYLKLATTREQIEKEKMKEEIKVLKAKAQALESAKHVEELYTEAIAAFKRYNGQYEEAYDENVL